MIQQKSILEQARSEGARSFGSQLSMVHADEVQDAYNRGRWQGRKDGDISEARWWRFGVLCGIALSTLVWAFWP